MTLFPKQDEQELRGKVMRLVSLILAGLILVLVLLRHQSSAVESASNVIIDMSAGGVHTCVLKDDGMAVCWGSDSFGQSSPPEDYVFSTIDSSSIMRGQIAAGGYHTCAIAAGGRQAICWGRNNKGQSSPPPSRQYQFVQLTAGELHTCGLTNTGRVVCWGDDSYGQLNPQGTTYTQVAAGAFHTCAIRTDETVDCWGANALGQGADPPLQRLPLLPPLSGEVMTPRRFVQIAAGAAHNCGVQVGNGSVYCWGDNTFGQRDLPVVNYDADVISAGGNLTCGLDGFFTSSDCWGGKPTDPKVFEENVSGNDEIKMMSVGAGHVCYVVLDTFRADKLVCNGDNSNGQANVPTKPGVVLGSFERDVQVMEGASIGIDVEEVFDYPGQDPSSLTYQWDFDSDFSFDDAQGISILFSADGLDGPTELTIWVRGVNEFGFHSGGLPIFVDVVNAPPTISEVSYQGPAVRGSTITISVDASDPGGDPLTFKFDCDGVSPYEVGPQAEPSAQCLFEGGSQTVKVLVTDDDGGATLASVEVADPTPTVVPTATPPPSVTLSPSTPEGADTTTPGSGDLQSGVDDTRTNGTADPDATPDEREVLADIETPKPTEDTDKESSAILEDRVQPSTALQSLDESDDSSSAVLPFLLGLLTALIVIAAAGAGVYRRKILHIIGRLRG